MGFSEEVSYGILIGVSVYCLFQVSFQVHALDVLAYVATAMAALSAIYEIEYSSSTAENLREWAEFFESFTYPCLVGYLYLLYGEEIYIAYAFPVLMLLLKLIGSDALGFDPSIMMAIGYAINQVACLYIGYEKENMCAMAATAVFFLTEVTLLFKEKIPLPPTETVNFGLAGTILLFSLAFQQAGNV